MKQLFFLLIITFTSCNLLDNKKVKLSGAGATFPTPYYNTVFKKYAALTCNNVTYGAIGSGGGTRSLLDQTIDFGATDVFLSDADIEKIQGEVIHIPTALGAVVLSYNLPNIKSLKITANIIADIYLGNITKWNDSRIAELNPELELPNKLITPVYRSDGSGTTAVFSDYMVKVNDQWKDKIGKGKSLKFPKGIAAKGNPGVAGIITETDGAFGYIGSEYALALNLPIAQLQNSSGNFITPNDKTISIAAEIDLPVDTRASITNSDNPEAYPISMFTWIILYKEQSYNQRNEVRAKALVDLLNFIISEEGQELAIKTHYAPLSVKAKEVTQSLINTMTYNGKPILE